MADNKVSISILGKLDSDETKRTIEKQLNNIGKLTDIKFGFDTATLTESLKKSKIEAEKFSEAMKSAADVSKTVYKPDENGIMQATSLQEKFNKTKDKTVLINTNLINGEIKGIGVTNKKIENEKKAAIEKQKAMEKEKAIQLEMLNLAEKMNYKFDSAQIAKQVAENEELITSKQKLIETLKNEKIKAEEVISISSHFGKAEDRAKVQKYADEIKNLAVKTDMTEDEIRAMNNQLKLSKTNLSAAGREVKSMSSNTLRLSEMFKTAVPKFIA